MTFRHQSSDEILMMPMYSVQASVERRDPNDADVFCLPKHQSISIVFSGQKEKVASNIIETERIELARYNNKAYFAGEHFFIFLRN